MRAGQQKAGSINVIDSHDRWVDEGALRFSIAGLRNSCQGTVPRKVFVITSDHFLRANLRARTHESFVSLQIAYLVITDLSCCVNFPCIHATFNDLGEKAD